MEGGAISVPVPGTAWGLFLQPHLISSTVVRSGYYYTHFTETKTEALNIHYAAKNHAIRKPGALPLTPKSPMFFPLYCTVS